MAFIPVTPEGTEPVELISERIRGTGFRAVTVMGYHRKMNAVLRTDGQDVPLPPHGDDQAR